MYMRVKTMLIAAAAAVAGLTAAAPAQAQLFYTDPVFPSGTVEPGDPLIGEELPGATPTEARAALIWNLRSGLNVLALRCQYWKYLRAVDVYNSVLAHHSAELAAAYKTLGGYFTRVKGQREGTRAFDQWSTRTYNNFQTEQSQGFCQTAASIGKDALTRRKGEFFNLARDRMRELRGSVAPYRDRIYLGGSALRPLPPELFVGPVCTGLTGRALQACQTGVPAPTR
jgi:hypothetical protein